MYPTPTYPKHRKNDPQFVRRFIENNAICWLCNGDGCKHCERGIQSWETFSRETHDADQIELGHFYTYCVKRLTTFNL